MPRPSEKKAANVNMSNFSKEIAEEKPKEVETAVNTNSNQDWTNDAQVNKTATETQPESKSKEPSELTFGGTSKRQQAINETAAKVANNETVTPEESNKAKSDLEELNKKYDDKYMNALAETQPDRFSTIATIMSALVTAATGGAIPFIPFNSITGNDQKIAYYNKIKAVYADNMQSLTTDVNKLEQQRDKEATSTDETLKSAQQFAKEEGARKTDADVYKAEKDKQNQAELLQLENDLRKDFSSLTTEQQKSLMSLAQDLQNKSKSEAITYLINTVKSGKFSNDELKQVAAVLSAYENGMTPNQVAAATANAWTGVITKPLDSVGNLLQAAKK